MAIADGGSYSQPPEPHFFASLSREKLIAHLVNFDFYEDELSGDLPQEFKVSAEILVELGQTECLDSVHFLGYHLRWIINQCPRLYLPEATDTIGALTPWNAR